MDNKMLAVCAMFENEARYLPEWLAYHRLVGVAEFVLYDNGSTDDPAMAIRNSPLADHVTLIHWRQRPGQLTAYKHFIDIFAAGFGWVAFLDVDQFLLPLNGGNVVDTLESLDHAAAVLVQRRVFGPGAWQQPPPGLVIENYDRRAADDDPANHHVTTIARCSELLGVTENPHEFRVNGSVFNTAGHLAPNHAVQVQPCYQNLVVNHYRTRSRQEFLAKLQHASASADASADATGDASAGAAAGPDEAALFDHLAAVCQLPDATIQSFAAAVRASLGLAAVPSPPPTEASNAAPALPEPPAPAAVVTGMVAATPVLAPNELPETEPQAAAEQVGSAPPVGAVPVSASSAAQPPPPAAPGTAADPRSEPPGPDAVAPAAMQTPAAVQAPAAMQAPAWIPRGPDAQERTGGLALIFRDRSRAGEHWLGALRGAAVAAIDPAFLHDEYDRIRDFPTADAARAACDAALAQEARP